MALPATELEAVIQQVIQEFLGDKLRIVETLHLDGKSPDRLRTIIGEFAAAAAEIRNGSAERRGSLLFAVVHRIELGANRSASSSSEAVFWDYCPTRQPMEQVYGTRHSASSRPFG